MRIELKRSLPSVQREQQCSCGGNQAWSHNNNFRLCGCGVVSCMDLLIYLCRYHPGCSAEMLSPLIHIDPIPLDVYDQTALRLSRWYLPLIPRRGLNGLSMAAGFDLFCLRNHIPYRARWGVSGKKLWSSIQSMLRQDIPVILAIGPNLPLFWQHNKLVFYRKNADGTFRPAAETLSHYVTVMGLDEQWLHISSWGREYYISRDEYLQYIYAHSSRIVSNILWVARTK